MNQDQARKAARRKSIALRSFTYGMMTITVAFGVLICFAWAMGFRFDLNSGKISQVALLQFNSFPSGANIEIDGKLLSDKTLTRANLKSGKIDVKMWKNGYRDWQKTIYAPPSSVFWLNYARLIPNNIATDEIATFSQNFDAKFSPDRRYLLIANFDQKRPHALSLWNLSDAKNPEKSEIILDEKVLPVHSDVQKKSRGELKILEWDAGSRYAILAQQIGEQTEFLLVDRTQPKHTKNISRDFGMDICEIHFADSGGRAFFALTGDVIRKFDYASKSVSAPLISNVESYKIFADNSFSFVVKEEKNVPCENEKSREKRAQISDNSNKNSAPKTAKNAKTDRQKSCETKKTIQNVGIFQDSKTTILRTFEDLTKTISDFAEYNGEKYLLIARNETVTLYSDPLNATNSEQRTASFSVPGGIDAAEFSPNGRFAVARNREKTVSYDADTAKNSTFDVAAQNFAWLDESHLVDFVNGRLTMVEFDGQNSENIVSAAKAAVSLSRDEKYIWSFAKNSTSGVSLQRSKIVVN